ncbi:MAG: signal recognition particle-docking protein FtsY [Candidatus Micrarchaeia archaeon]
MLKKKIGSFISKLTKKEEKKIQAPPSETEHETPLTTEETQVPKTEDKPVLPKKASPEPEKTAAKPQAIATPKPTHAKVEEPEVSLQDVEVKTTAQTPSPKKETPETEALQKPEIPTPKDEPKKERDFSPKLGIVSRIKSVFSPQITITKEETNDLFDEFEIALLESDVSYETSQTLVQDMKTRLIGKQVDKNNASQTLRAEIAVSLKKILESAQQYDLQAKIQEAKNSGEPFKILFLGPNGAGKTTTIAKFASMLKSKGYSSVIAASDTFRAAAIEQSMHHGQKLNVKVVKHTYGSDPAAVAFDAIKHAKANKVDVVLIDTAGRQETNRNLLEEMRKISRVCNPDAKIFVGESIAGNALIEQVKSFNQAVNLDAVILTKIDCDAKGGNSISITHDTRLPILFLGIGQEYDALMPFDSSFIVKKVLEE